MSRVEIVTSFSPAGAAIGDLCLVSLRAMWPHPTVVYVDAPIEIAGITVRRTDAIHDWPATQAMLPATRPDAPKTGRDVWTRKPASYLWNAQKFAVKPFVWHDAATRLESGVLIWLDADTVTKASVPPTFAADLLGDADVAYLGRGAMHPETGFVAFRIPEALPLLAWCCQCYASGAYAAIDSGWTDCHVLRAGLQALDVRARDLTAHVAGEWRSGMDAFALSPLGPYVDHFKGGIRKREAA